MFQRPERKSSRRSKPDGSGAVWAFRTERKRLFNENNYTRFFIIAPKMEISDKADKITLAISVRHEPGALYHVLGYFSTAV